MEWIVVYVWQLTLLVVDIVNLLLRSLLEIQFYLNIFSLSVALLAALLRAARKGPLYEGDVMVKCESVWILELWCNAGDIMWR